ncbi:MAG: aldo/keto reductase [Bacteroidota bacterium]|nr:aldo/keto reductase [Bacteroidota bacterium]
MITRKIPSSGEELPVVGIGTWKSFDVEQDQYPTLKKVLDALHNGGGRLIDSSPMYGKSEEVIGAITSETDTANDFFYATKVWTTGKEQGIHQMKTSIKKMGRKTMDLMQIHNLTDWKTHMPQLRRWKEEGLIRYIGITHYTDASHEMLEKVMQSEKPDFVQLNYSIESRNAEKRLLDAASSLGIATLINRPFGTGDLFNKVKSKSLPGWAVENEIETWSEYFLKYIIAHPAVTCVIPATGNLEHEHENVKAGIGKLPEEELRKLMIDYLQRLP